MVSVTIGRKRYIAVERPSLSRLELDVKGVAREVGEARVGISFLSPIVELEKASKVLKLRKMLRETLEEGEIGRFERDFKGLKLREALHKELPFELLKPFSPYILSPNAKLSLPSAISLLSSTAKAVGESFVYLYLLGEAMARAAMADEKVDRILEEGQKELGAHFVWMLYTIGGVLSYAKEALESFEKASTVISYLPFSFGGPTEAFSLAYVRALGEVEEIVSRLWMGGSEIVLRSVMAFFSDKDLSERLVGKEAKVALAMDADVVFVSLPAFNIIKEIARRAN